MKMAPNRRRSLGKEEPAQTKLECSVGLEISPVGGRRLRVYQRRAHQYEDCSISECMSDDELEDNGDGVLEGVELPPLQPLPPSSGDLTVPDELVAELLAVYSFLRSFSWTLFLSPFCLEDFVTALYTETSNNLIDSVHVSLLCALKRHLQRLAQEGSNKA
eukprot:c50312_g1_i1 orf=1-480(-)